MLALVQQDSAGSEFEEKEAALLQGDLDDGGVCFGLDSAFSLGWWSLWQVNWCYALGKPGSGSSWRLLKFAADSVD